MADKSKESVESKKDELNADELNIGKLDTVTAGTDTTPTPKVTLHVRKAGGEHVEF